MQLRDYQIEAEQKIYKAWAEGFQNVCVPFPTGTGKTVLFTKIISNQKLPTLAIAHRMELIDQMSLTLAKYNIPHKVIAQPLTIRSIVALHMAEFNRSFYFPQSAIAVAGVDTLLKVKDTTTLNWLKTVQLIIVDEAHHVLKTNKWGKAVAFCPQARGLFPTATPRRTDGCGLGRHADGVIDSIIDTITMEEAINRGYLTKYRIINKPSNIDLSKVAITASGDYSPPQLRNVVHKAQITGDVVQHYLKFASGKLGVTFTVDVETAIETAAAYNAAGVPAEVLSGKTPGALRVQILNRFRRKEILQIVNVDILSEGVDVPAIEVVSMARPTQSLVVYLQQIGRALRPMPGKTHGIIIDHVGNVERHGLPSIPRGWSLDRRERRRSTAEDVIAIKTCLNPECMSAFEKYHRVCPYCGYFTPPAQRSSPEFVDGDLTELDPEIINKILNEIKRIDGPPRSPVDVENHVHLAINKRHLERQKAQAILREVIALWAGYQRTLNKTDSEIYRLFYYLFKIDIMTAQTLNAKDAENLTKRVQEIVNKHGVIAA